MRELDTKFSAIFVIGGAHGQDRRARLTIPELEYVEIAARDPREAGQEILDRCGLAVAAPEIKVHAGAKLHRADQQLQHPDDLGALLVYRRRVEVVDLVIGLRTDIMRERAGVLGKLSRLQRADIGDALDGR